MAATLTDRIYAEMRRSERTWTAEELCRDFLRMDSSGPIAASLVRSILGQEPRFEETESGEWSALRTKPAKRVWSSSLRLYWIEAQGERIEDWRLHTALWRAGRTGETEVWDLSTPDPWLRGRRGEGTLPWAGYQPNLLRRVLLWADRVWASSETEVEPIDLRRWGAVGWIDQHRGQLPSPTDLTLPKVASLWSLGPLEESPAGCLKLLGALLDHLSGLYPSGSPESFQKSFADAMERRPVDWASLGFGPEVLTQVPPGPGVYRFFSATQSLLYVGKSRDLPARVRSYFQNFPQTPTKREELVHQIRRIEIEPVSTELEALVRESRAIREESPDFNVQIEVRPPNRFPKSWQWPLVYVAAGPEGVTVVGLSGPDRGTLLPIRAAEPELDIEILARWSESLLSPPGAVSLPDSGTPTDAGTPTGSGTPTDSDSPTEERANDEPLVTRPSRGGCDLDPQESWLALRYYSRCHGSLDRVDPLAITSAEALTDLLLPLLEERADSGPRLVREPT